MITHKQFMRALKKRTEADLLISQYNLQESKKLVDLSQEAREIAHTFQNGHKTAGECFTEAFQYLINRIYDKRNS